MKLKDAMILVSQKVGDKTMAGILQRSDFKSRPGCCTPLPKEKTISK